MVNNVVDTVRCCRSFNVDILISLPISELFMNKPCRFYYQKSYSTSNINSCTVSGLVYRFGLVMTNAYILEMSIFGYISKRRFPHQFCMLRRPVFDVKTQVNLIVEFAKFIEPITCYPIPYRFLSSRDEPVLPRFVITRKVHKMLVREIFANPPTSVSSFPRTITIEIDSTFIGW